VVDGNAERVPPSSLGAPELLGNPVASLPGACPSGVSRLPPDSSRATRRPTFLAERVRVE
jgi:hypothetical protein